MKYCLFYNILKSLDIIAESLIITTLKIYLFKNLVNKKGDYSWETNFIEFCYYN